MSKALLIFPVPIAKQILEMMASGRGHRPIAEYIRSQGIKMQDRKVAMILAEERAARAPVASSVAREMVAPEIDEQLDTLSDVKRRLMNLMELYDGNRKNTGDHGMLLKIVDRLHKNIELYQKFAGIGEVNKGDEAEGSRRLSDKLATLASKLAGVDEKKEDSDIEVVEVDSEN